MQTIVVTQQLREHCETQRACATCRAPRALKDYRRRWLDTVLGTVQIEAPRYCGCRVCSETRISNPVSELLPGRATSELRHLQVSLGARMPYRKAASILREFLPPCGGTNHATVRNRVVAVGQRIESEIAKEVAAFREPEQPAKEMVVGIDGAFVKGCPPTGPPSLEIVMGCIDTAAAASTVFAIVRDQDKQAKQQVQALLRRHGRGSETQVRILCDGEDGMRSMVGKWFNGKEKHVLDWYHVVRQLDAIGKALLYLPRVEGFGELLSRHWVNLNRARWKLWDGNLYGAGIALSCLWNGVDVHVVLAGSGRDQAELVRQRLDKLWQYLCANEARLINYGKEHRRGHRVSTAHVESMVNRLVNWRMCKKQQTRWTERGAQMLLHARCALLNGELARHTGWVAPSSAVMAAA